MSLTKRVLAAALVLGMGFSTEAFAGTVIFAPPGAEYTFSQDIDSAGNVAGFFNDVTGRHGFVYDGTSYTVIDLPGAVETAINGMNDLGQLAGFFNDGNPNARRGFLKTGNTETILEFPGSTWTQAWDVNDGGVVVGYFADQAGVIHSFIYKGGSFTQLDFPGAGVTVARGINNAGRIVGYYTDAANTAHGFIFEGGTFSTFDPPGSVGTWISGVNNLGHLAGNYRKIVKKKTATLYFTYDGNSVKHYDIPDFIESNLNGINDRGEVTGEGYIVGQSGTKGFLIDNTTQLADLVVTEVRGPKSGRQGETITVTVTIENRGTAIAAGTSWFGLYLSADADITTDDFKRATVYVTDLAPGESRSYSVDYLILGAIPVGTYYHGAIADETELVTEANEFNNALAGNTIQVREQKGF